MAILDVQHLYKTYRQRSSVVAAVQDICLQIQAGDVLAFLGANGAGKTTTIKMIAGLISPDWGSVSIAGFNPHRDARALRQVGAVLEGNRNVYWRLTPQENLEYFGVLRGLSRRVARQRAQVLLERFDLGAKQATTVQKLSRGMQQKVAIAVALIHNPQLLLLDEPTLGLDVEAVQAVKQLVRQIADEGRAILLTTHQLDVAEELSDRVAIIQQGRLVAETATDELIQQFSSSSYVVELAVPLPPDIISKLDRLGAVAKPLSVYVPDPELLYSILDILKPLPILRVEKEQANLTDIFLQLVRGEQRD
jgi:ABC-2 type transport system ATP-binding protein